MTDFVHTDSWQGKVIYLYELIFCIYYQKLDKHLHWSTNKAVLNGGYDTSDNCAYYETSQD